MEMPHTDHCDIFARQMMNVFICFVTIAVVFILDFVKDSVLTLSVLVSAHLVLLMLCAKKCIVPTNLDPHNAVKTVMSLVRQYHINFWGWILFPIIVSVIRFIKSPELIWSNEVWFNQVLRIIFSVGFLFGYYGGNALGEMRIRYYLKRKGDLEFTIMMAWHFFVYYGASIIVLLGLKSHYDC